MSANVITFEGQYMADQMRNIDRAKTLTEEAMSIIKSASQHRNWRCNETKEIDNGIDIISRRLQRLNMGIIRTGNALGKGLVSFTELEKRSESQANTLSSNLQNNYGFEATDRTTNSDTTLSILMIPTIPIGRITVAILTQWFNEVNRKIKEFWDKIFRRKSNNNDNYVPESTPFPTPAPTPEPNPEPASNLESEPEQVQDSQPSESTAPVATQVSDKWGWNTENLPFSHNTPDMSSDAYNRPNSDVIVNTRELYNKWAGENRVNCVYYARARYLEINGGDKYPFSINQMIHDPEYIKNGNCVVRFDNHSVYVEHYDAANNVVWFSDSNMGSHADGALQSMSFEEFVNFKGGFQFVEGVA
ncbi:MAG: hypothetical protein IJQ57_11625 [Synergistaceae bacterium]|nr:hypothetical protein [Synergistaceae bacterium]